MGLSGSTSLSEDSRADSARLVCGLATGVSGACSATLSFAGTAVETSDEGAVSSVLLSGMILYGCFIVGWSLLTGYG